MKCICFLRTLTIAYPSQSYPFMPTLKASQAPDPSEEPFLPSAEDQINLLKASGFQFPPNTQPTLLSQIPDKTNPGYVAEMRDKSNVLGLGPSEDVGEVFKAIILVSSVGQMIELESRMNISLELILILLSSCPGCGRSSHSLSFTSRWTCPSLSSNPAQFLHPICSTN